MSENLVTNSIKLSQPAGATLAFMGVKDSIPLWHSVQGCAAFAKILFIQHFREPMPFQTTALNHVSVVMGGDGEITEALDNVKGDARVIGLHTTGVAETSGVDMMGAIKKFRKENPGKTVVWVNTPDYEGSLQTGWVKACEATVKTLTRPRTAPRKKQVAVLVGPYFTPAEIENIKELIELFGLRPVVFPDLGDSLLGYTTDDEFSPRTIGGTPIEEIETLSNSAFVVSLGRSMKQFAKRFAGENGREAVHFDSLGTLTELDAFFRLLSDKSGVLVPEKIRRGRRHLQDVILDTQFYFSGKRAAIAGDPEFIIRWKEPLKGMGVKSVCVSSISDDDFMKGDLADLEALISDYPADLLIGSSHVAELAEKIGIPVVRAGLPVYDRIGEPQKVRLGYMGAAQLYMECANEWISSHKNKTPYISKLQETLR